MAYDDSLFRRKLFGISDYNEDAGGFSPEHTNESLFPTPPKPQGKKQTGATGASGPPPPRTPVPASSPFSSNPALANALNQHFDTPTGNTWQDRAANLASTAAEQFGNRSEPVVARPPEGMTLREMLQAGNVQGFDTIRNPNGGYNWVPTPAAPTTLDKQNELLSNAQVPGGGGGILPGWNSPTGQNIDLTAFGPKEVDISAAGPTPPSGWLNSAITAARSGANTYNTGGFKAEGNSPQGGIATANGRDYAGTPSGGTVGLNTGTNRTDLINAISRSQTPDKRDENQYQGGY